MFEPRKRRGVANLNGSNVILLLWIILYLVDIYGKEDQKLKQGSLFKTLEQSKM
jgi:hypothetical protein